MYKGDRIAKKSSRFIGFEILKFICAFFIVCIHTPYPDAVGEYFTALIRIAVPIFFMITGFYYNDIIRRGRTKDQIKKILALVVQANFLYLLWKCLYAVFSGNGLIQYLVEIFTVKNAVKFVVLNDSPLNGHLWYLGAIFYVLLIVEALRKFGGEGDWKQVLYLSTPLLLIGDLLLGKYSILIWGREFSYIFVRNWLFVGLPYFSVGMMLREKRSTVEGIPAWLLATLTVLFSLTTLCERFFLVSMDANTTRDHYISTTFLAIAVFLLFKTFYQGRTPGRIETWMADIGKKHSAWVYIVHPIFITGIAVVMRRIGLVGVYRYVAPFVVYGVSIVFVAVMNKLIIHCKLKVKSGIP